MGKLSFNKRTATLIIAAAISLLPTQIVFSQEVGQFALRARVNLYESWNFDSVAYYLDRVIGKKDAPAYAYSDYGWYLMLVDRYEEGLSYIQRAAKMAPNNKQLVAWNAWALLWDDDLPAAKRWIDKALAIDPDYGEALYVGSMIASATGDHAVAIRLAEKAAAKDPNFRASLPLALAKAGKREQAIRAAQKIAEDEQMLDTMILMEVYAHLRDDDRALYFLRRGYELRHPFVPWLQLTPGTEHLHADPRFMAIVKKINLPQ